MLREVKVPERPGRKIIVSKEQLKRVVGLGGLYSIGYGDVGSSIYYALGITAAWALGATPIAIGIAGIFFSFTALTYAECASAIAEPGGSSCFARRAFNEFVSFIAGWALLLSYVVTISISAYTIGPYLGYFFPLLLSSHWANITFACGIILILVIINIIGIRESTLISFSLCMLGNFTQFSIIILGMFLLFSPAKILSQINFGSAPTWGGFFQGLAFAMVAYTGIESISQLAGEAKSPGKTIPRAAILILFSVIIMNLGVSIVAFSAMSPETLLTRFKEDPIAGIANFMPGLKNILAPWIAILAATILFVATNAGIIGASRLAYSMSAHAQLPKELYQLNLKSKTPHIAIVFFSLIAILIIVIGKRMSSLGEIYVFGSVIGFAISHLSVIWLRVREPELHRPFKIKPNLKIKNYEIPITAILGFLGTFTVFIMILVRFPFGRNAGIPWMLIGILGYLLYRRKYRLPIAEPVLPEIVSLSYEPIQIKKILVPTIGTPKSEMIQAACRLAKTDGAVIEAIYVIEVPMTLPVETNLPKEVEKAERALDLAELIAKENGVRINTRLFQSRSAGRTIIEEAEASGCDLILLNRGEKKKLLGPLAGKTIEFVVKHAPCNVWVSTYK